MAKRSAPDPEINIVAVRAAARRAALLFAKGIGERVVLREAAVIFDALCPKLPRGLARWGRKLAVAETQARKPVPVGKPSGVQPPPALLAALARPALPGDQPAPLVDASGAISRPVRQATGEQVGKPISTGAGYARGNLRLILGGQSTVG